jgi:hypothetical protein
MIGIRDFFVEMGSSAEQRVDQLSERAASLEERRAAYDRIEAQFSTMTADGVLDEREAERLFSELKKAGLDTAELQQIYQSMKGLDSSVRAGGASALERALDLELGAARARVGDQLAEISNRVSQEQFLIETGYASAADYNKKEHDTYMTIIKNMVA